jgi:HK97 gp10 family phage protein
MADDLVRVEVEGLPELLQRLDTVSADVAAACVGEALLNCAEVFGNEAVARAPVHSGRLVVSEIAKVLAPKYAGVAGAIIGVEYRGIRARHARNLRLRAAHRPGKPSTEDPGVYSWWVEVGTQFTAAHPFMRPAFDAGVESALAAFRDTLAARLPVLGGQGNSSDSGGFAAEIAGDVAE